MRKLLFLFLAFVPLILAATEAEAQGVFSKSPILSTVNKITVPTSTTGTVIFQDTATPLAGRKPLYYEVKKADLVSNPFHFGYKNGNVRVMAPGGELLFFEPLRGFKLIGDGTTVIGSQTEAGDSLKSRHLRTYFLKP